MQWFKRIALFLTVNILVILSISLILALFNVRPYLTSHGLDYESLLIFCLVWGFVGSLISLALSRVMAKWAMGVKVIDPHTENFELREVVRMVEVLATRLQSPVPEVGVFESPEVNAFATGPTKKRSLIAVSTGALRQLTKPELEAVLGHEMSHIANGDMVTMTLLQGVVNAFVMFFARLLAYVISMRGRDNRERSVGMSYYLLVALFEIVFMLLGSIVIAGFSRWREYRADAGGARLCGKQNMIGALEHLEMIQTKKLKGAQQSLAPFMIHSRQEPTIIMKLFATHPPIKERVERLKHL